MSDLSGDPVIGAIYKGIKEDIRFNLEGRRLAAVLTLTLAGIDAMAWLAAPEGQDEVTRDDFVTWAERYLPIADGRPLTGLDLYGARCAVLHQYGARSRLSREARCRLIMWADKMKPPVGPVTRTSEGEVLLVSIAALAQAFLGGIDRFLVDAFAVESRGKLVEKRTRGLIQALPYPKEG